MVLVTSGYRWSETCCVHLGFNRLRAIGLCTLIDCDRGKSIIVLRQYVSAFNAIAVVCRSGNK